MISLKNILLHYNVVIVNYERGGGYSALSYRGRYKSGEVIYSHPEIITERDKFSNSFPLLLYVCGYGVINKPEEQASQIVSDGETFISTLQSNGTVCFVRRSQIEPLLERTGNSLLNIACVGVDVDAVSLGRDFYLSHVNLRNMLRLDALGAQLSTQLYKKAQLPVLMAVLGVLLINFAIGGTVDKKYNENSALLITLQNAKGRQDELSKQEQDMLKEIARGINSGFAYLSDCIGLAVPESVILHNLSIQPPIRRIEEGKPYNIEMYKIIIKGNSTDAAGISLFVSQLKEIERVRNLKISSVEQNREGQSLNFIIEVEV